VVEKCPLSGHISTTLAHNPSVTFTGAPVPGTLYMLAGPNGLDSDVYEVQASFAHVQRLTYTAGVGFGGIAARYGRVIVDAPPRNGVGNIRVLVIKDGAARLGTTLARYGYAPALGPGGRYSYAAFDGENAIYIGRFGRRGARIVVRSRAELVDSAWSPSGELAVLEGTGRDARVIIGVGTAHPLTVTPRLRGLSEMKGCGPAGTIELEASGFRQGLLSSNGSVRILHTDWIPQCVSPNGRDVLSSAAMLVDLACCR
jgi:hypothetical protein